MTTNDKLKEGDRVKLVSNVITRKYGMRTGGSYQEKHDDHAWPGEIAVVTRSAYTAHDSSAMAHWYLQYSRGRLVTLATPGDAGSAKAKYATFYTERDAEDFRRVR